MSVSRAELKKKAFSGFVWSFAEKIGSQLTGFLITLLLARLLTPEDFGLVAMSTVFYAIARVLIDGGLRDSLIQQKESTQIDYNTVFFFNASAGILIYILVFFLAPFIADFYGYPQLVLIIRVLGINILVYAFVIVQMASLTKKLEFKLLLKISLPSTIISGAIGLLCAWRGLGVWALIIQMVLESVIYTVLLWVIVKWRPTLEFSLVTFKYHVVHGSRLVFVDILNVLYRNIYPIVIGKFYNTSLVGFFNRADTFKSFTYNNTTGLIQTVSYPVLAQLQNDDELLKRAYRKILQSTLIVVLPVCVLLITLSEQIISFLLTDKWLPAAPMLMILTLVNVLLPFNAMNLNVLKIKRRADLLVRVEIFNKVLLLILIGISLTIGFYYVLWSSVVMAVIALFTYNYYSNKLIRYSIKEQLNDILPFLMAFIISISATWLTLKLLGGLENFVILLIGSTVALSSYILVIFAFSRKLLFSLIDMIRSLFKKGNMSENVT